MEKKVKKQEDMKKETFISRKSLQSVLIEPWITESATRKMELNKYVFRVDPKADKAKIKKSIEKIYKVTVEKVNIINIPRKKRELGRTAGWKAGFKKAIATLKEGDSIEIFEK